MKRLNPLFSLGLTALILCGAAKTVRAEEAEGWELPAEVQVDSSGIFLDQVINTIPAHTLPHVLLAPAPALGPAPCSFPSSDYRIGAEKDL